MEDFAAIAVVFDPRYKMDLIKFILTEEVKLHTLETQEKLDKIKKTLYAWFEEITAWKKKTKDSNESHPASSDVSSNHVVEEKNVESRFKTYLARKNTHNMLLATAEIDLYLQESAISVEPTDTKFDILSWWKVHTVQFPTLLTLAQQILMTPMTSISSESAFSTGGRVLSDSRNRLKPETLEALICARDWIMTDEGLNYIDGNAESETE